jgi:hypothetical protein
MVLFYRYLLGYNVQFRRRAQTFPGNNIPGISGLKTTLRGNTGNVLPNCMVTRIIKKVQIFNVISAIKTYVLSRHETCHARLNPI